MPYTNKTMPSMNTAIIGNRSNAINYLFPKVRRILSGLHYKKQDGKPGRFLTLHNKNFRLGFLSTEHNFLKKIPSRQCLLFKLKEHIGGPQVLYRDALILVNCNVCEPVNSLDSCSESLSYLNEHFN